MKAFNFQKIFDKRHHIFFKLVLLAAFPSCSFNKYSETQKSPVAKASEDKDYDALDLDLNSTAPLHPTRGQPPVKQTLTEGSRPNCEKMAKRVPVGYRNLLAHRNPSLRIPENSVINRIAAITPDHCLDPARANDTTRLLIEAVSNFSPKIVVLLPLTGANGAQGKAVYDGIRSRMGMTGIKPEQVIFRDTNSKDSFSENWIAEAVFLHQAGLIIGGLTRGEEIMLRTYANQLYLPTLLLAPPLRENSLSSPYVFNVFPNEMAMNEALLTKATGRGVKRVGVLLPSGRNDSDLVQSFLEMAKQKGMSITGPFTYEPGTYDSMERAASQIFKTNRGERSREYQEALKKAKDKAAAEGKPFDPRFVILKPIVDVDAVFIPDNFKTIRYFAKIFKYLGVEKMTMLGNQEWRATPLIQPYEPYLEGSMFSDYIGYYNELPHTFRPFAGDNKKFLMGLYAGTFDLKSIGLQAFQIASNAIRIPTQKRYQLVNTLRLLGSGPEDITRAPSVFDRFNRFNWPAYVFEITNKDIFLRR